MTDSNHHFTIMLCYACTPRQKSKTSLKMLEALGLFAPALYQGETLPFGGWGDVMAFILRFNLLTFNFS